MDFPLNYSIQKAGLPLIVTSSKPHLCFLVDSGSTQNIIFSYVLTALDEVNLNLTDTTTSITGITGSVMESKQMEFGVTFGETWYEATWSIVEAPQAIIQLQNETGLQVHGILGVPFLTQNEWIIDFKNLTITQ